MSEYEVLATLTDEEARQMFKFNAKKQAAKDIINKVQENLERINEEEMDFFNEIRAKYSITEPVIHFCGTDNTIRKGWAK